MDDVYEVDNRYPEVFEPYEKIRGVRRHGGLENARRAARFNQVKRGFWTAAAAAVSAVTLLLASFGGGSQAAAPEPFQDPRVEIIATAPSGTTEASAPPETETLYTEVPETEPPVTEATPTELFTAPTLAVAAAELSGPTGTTLRYSCQAELNSAQWIELRAEVCADSGELLGIDAPHRLQTSGVAPTRDILLQWTKRPANLTLTLTGTYLEKGEEKTLTAAQTLEIPPYIAPTLTVTEAAINGTEATSLNYRYQISLNSAKTLRVTATVQSDTGAALGSDGPYDHSASESSPLRSAALSWTTRPSSLTLTLTGSYVEDGEEKTVTAVETLSVPALPFTAPTLAITDASVYGIAVTPLSYSYRVTLNSAREMQVSATIRSGSGETLGSDGPYTHTTSDSSPTRSAALSWTTRPSTVTLYLTGSYTENGVQKTITVSRLLDVPPEVFDPPTLSIYTARIDDMDSSTVVYSVGVQLYENSNPVSVTVSVVEESGNSCGSAGPYSFTESGSLYNQVLRCSSSLDEDMSLLVTATYSMNGMPRTVTARKGLEEGSPFEWPELELMDVKFVPGSTSMLRYSYNLVMNSASSLRVKAQFYDESDNLIYETGYTEHGPDSDGDSVTVDPGVRPARMRLVGEFDHLGKTYTVSDSRDLTSLSVAWPNFRHLPGQNGSGRNETDR